MFGPRVWAIDLGRSAIKGVLMTPVKGGVEILDADIVPLKGEAPESLKEPSRDMRLWEALTEFENRNQIHKAPVAIAISPQNTLVREIKIAVVGKRNLQELVQFEASNAIPYVLDEVYWDYHLFDAAQDESTREGVIFAVKKNAIHTYLHALSQVGAERVTEITISPLAALTFLQFEMGMKGSAMLLDLGAENTGVIAIEGSRFWVRSIGAGGSQITQLLQQNFSLSFEQAEDVKHGIAKSDLAADLVEVVKPGIHSLVAELKTNLDYLRRSGKSIEFERVYAVGGASRLVGLKAQIRQSLGQDLHDIHSLEHIFVSPHADVRLIQTNLDRLAVAIGTGIKALGKAPADLSFVPETTARMAQSSPTKRFLFITGLLLWAILGTLAFFCTQYEQLLSGAGDQSRRVGVLYNRNTANLKAAKKRTEIEQELALLQSLGQGREQVAAVLDKAVSVFLEANKRPGCTFVMTSLGCQPQFHNANDPQDELTVIIKGKVFLPPEGNPSEAYDLLRSRVLNQLLGSPLFARSKGIATFTDDKMNVAGESTQWSGLVANGDQIRADKDGIWYKVHEVKSDTALVLTQAFAGGNMQSEFTIARVEVFHWNFDTREFGVRAQVPTKVLRLKPVPKEAPKEKEPPP